MPQLSIETLTNLAAVVVAALVPGGLAAGILPRLGPGRAVALALRSLAHRSETQSLRTEAIRQLLEMLRVQDGGQYVVVNGQKGVGKSVVVETATQQTCGVTSVPVSPGTPTKTIVLDVLNEIANSRVGWIDPRPSVRRILWFYQHFLRLPRPIVVLRALERCDGQDFAGLSGAARELAGLGLRVLVDGSSDSLPPELLKTEREAVLDVDAMPLNVLRSIPKYAGLFSTLREEGLESVVMGVLGGVPASYDQLVTALAVAGLSDMRGFIIARVRAKIAEAISCRDLLLCKHPAMRAVLTEFKSRGAVPQSILADKRIEIPSPNKVLRCTFIDGCVMLVPANAATALVLQHGLERAPRVEVLAQLLPEL